MTRRGGSHGCYGLLPGPTAWSGRHSFAVGLNVTGVSAVTLRLRLKLTRQGQHRSGDVDGNAGSGQSVSRTAADAGGRYHGDAGQMQRSVQRSAGRTESRGSWLHQLSGACRAAGNAHRLDKERTGRHSVSPFVVSLHFASLHLSSNSKYKYSVYNMQLTAVWEAAARHEVH